MHKFYMKGMRNTVGKKYFCWNIDDGLEQDKKIIKILKEYGMGATFNLNSGLLGQREMIGRIGDWGIRNVPLDRYRKSLSILKYGKAYRIPEDEVKEVYAGFEIAGHGYRHENLKKVSEEMAQESVNADVNALSDLFDTKIIGFAYPYGAYTESTEKYLKKAGIQYARTVDKTMGFQKPADLMHIPITDWHINGDAIEHIQAFLNADVGKDDLFFLMFAHGYEFDFGTKNSNWEKFRQICDMVSSCEDVICCSTAEALGLR